MVAEKRIATLEHEFRERSQAERARAVADLREQLDQEKRAAVAKVEARQKEQSDAALQQLEQRLSRETAQKLSERDAASKEMLERALDLSLIHI